MINNNSSESSSSSSDDTHHLIDQQQHHSTTTNDQQQEQLEEQSESTTSTSNTTNTIKLVSFNYYINTNTNNNNTNNNNTEQSQQQYELIDLTHEMTFEILSFLNTNELTLCSMLNKDWYEYINGQLYSNIPNIDNTNMEINTPCNQLWKHLLLYEFNILYFPFHKFTTTIYNQHKITNYRTCCQVLQKNLNKFNEITKQQFNSRPQQDIDSTNIDNNTIFIRVHLKGYSKTGKSKIVNAICDQTNKYLNEENYEKTEDFRILMKSYQLKNNSNLKNNLNENNENDENTTSKYIQISFQDHGGEKSIHSRPSLFSANLYSGKTFVFYVFNEELPSLVNLPFWKLDTNKSLNGLKVKSNSIIGKKLDLDSKPLLEIMLLNCFYNLKEENLIKYLNNNLNSNTTNNSTDNKIVVDKAIELANGYEIPLMVCDSKNVQSVKRVMIICNILELLIWDEL